MKLVNLDNGQVIATNVQKAYTFAKRLKGLMFTSESSSGCALHIRPCRSIHTFFMNYAIDVLYLDPDQKIVEVDEYIQPRRIGKMVKKAFSVVELPAGRIKETQTTIGQAVQFETL